jgi:hypothetical protein
MGNVRIINPVKNKDAKVIFREPLICESKSSASISSDVFQLAQNDNILQRSMQKAIKCLIRDSESEI